jgi:hypothetical protein
MSWLETIPLTAFAGFTLASLLLAMELGYRAPVWLHGRDFGHGGEGPDYLLSAVLGLLALLLGFTFSLGLNRYEARRDLVVQEANAMGTAWLRSQLLPEPDKETMSRSLRRYLDARLVWSETDSAPDGIRREKEAQKALWEEIGHVVRADTHSQLGRALMDSVNESFDMASSRAAARNAHIPARVLHTLLLYAALSTLMLGYTSAGRGRSHRMAMMLVPVLLALALTVILDVDQPRSGAILVSQQPLLDLKQSWQ